LGVRLAEVEVFLAGDQAFGLRGGGNGGGRVAAVSLSTGERWSGNNAS